MNTARQSSTGFGIQTSAVVVGGDNPSILGATELWNGTSWTTNPNSLATARNALAKNGAGTTASGVVAGGDSGPPTRNLTEEWTGPGAPVTQTITTS